MEALRAPIRCRWIAALLLAAALPRASQAAPPLRSELVASGLAQPVFATAPAGDARLFIVERAGTVRILAGGSVLPTPFLDISALVSTAGAFGFFGLAFAPDYAVSGLFYVYYMNAASESIVARYQVSADPNVADPVGETVIAIPQTDLDHNGGSIAFRPTDGMLYIAPGDGGGGPYDPFEMGQNPLNWLGKMLRIDVSGGPGTSYTVPPDNPFVGNPGVLDEIWAFGLRNPFRWSFDRGTGDLWIGDVGQGAVEELDYEPAADPGGHNYGWDVMEGTLCVTVDPAPAPPCNDPSLTLPLFEYDHDANPTCSGSVTGGFVYRGARIPGLVGHYVFADWCRSQIWSLDPATLQLEDLTAALDPADPGLAIENIVSLGEDGMGELYLIDIFGEVFAIRSDAPIPALRGWGLALLAGLLFSALAHRARMRRGASRGFFRI